MMEGFLPLNLFKVVSTQLSGKSTVACDMELGWCWEVVSFSVVWASGDGEPPCVGSGLGGHGSADYDRVCAGHGAKHFKYLISFEFSWKPCGAESHICYFGGIQTQFCLIPNPRFGIRSCLSQSASQLWHVGWLEVILSRSRPEGTHKAGIGLGTG